MTSIVIEHVALQDLPSAWRAHLPATAGSHVTVRIEEEPEKLPGGADLAGSHPMFGMWQDRDDMEDVTAYARQLRAPRQEQD